jgi:hypothetical protein
MVFLIGSGTSAIRYIPRYLKPNKRERLVNYVRWTYTRLGIFFALYYVVLGLTDLTLHTICPQERNDLIVNSLYLVPLLSLAYLWCSFIKANGFRQVGMLSKYVFRYGSASVIILALVFFLQDQINYVLAEIVAALSIIITCLLSWLLLRTLTTNFPRISQCFQTKKIVGKKSWIRNAKSYFINRSAFMATNIAPFYITLFASQKDETIAYYAFITTLISVFRLLSESIALNLGNRVSYLYRKKDLTSLMREVANTNLALLVSELVFTAVFILFSQQIGGIFGDKFDLPVVRMGALILITSFLLESFSRSSVSLLMYTNHQKKLASQNIFSLGFIVVAGIPAVYFYGLLGICSVYAIKQLATSVTSIYWVKKHLNFNPLIYLARQVR